MPRGKGIYRDEPRAEPVGPRDDGDPTTRQERQRTDQEEPANPPPPEPPD
ncbi:MAG: hypothetical protein U0Q20_10045 [Mycobacterium sp.]|nr:hypothetical protein [Mycobacterium sp.]